LAIYDFNQAVKLQKNFSQALFCRGMSRIHISSSMETMYSPNKHEDCYYENNNLVHVCKEGDPKLLKGRLPLEQAIQDFKDAL